MASDSVAMKSEGGGGGGGGAVDLIFKGLKKARRDRGCTAKDRISKMPPCAAGKRSSIYRGVTRHRWTGRYEAHLWDKSTWNQNQNKKGKQVYLGAYDDEEAAARAYDLAALKYWGPGTIINFPVTDYSRDLEEMQMVSREDYLASLRRKSSGFSRGLSKYRGISRPPQNQWETSFGRMLGSEYFNNLNCGTSEDAAAESELVAGFCLERKIDLTGYIRWWGPQKARHTDSRTKTSEGSHNICEDVGTELKTLEWSVQHTEPYQFPSLGLPHSKKFTLSVVSAFSIVSQSEALKSLQDKVSRASQVKNIDKLITEDGSGKSALPLASSELHHDRTPYPLGPVVSASLLTSCSAIDHQDPLIWTSIVPSTGPSSSAMLSESCPLSSTAIWRKSA